MVTLNLSSVLAVHGYMVEASSANPRLIYDLFRASTIQIGGLGILHKCCTRNLYLDFPTLKKFLKGGWTLLPLSVTLIRCCTVSSCGSLKKNYFIFFNICGVLGNHGLGWKSKVFSRVKNVKKKWKISFFGTSSSTSDFSDPIWPRDFRIGIFSSL